MMSTNTRINQPVHINHSVSCKLDFNNFLDWSYEVCEIITPLGLKGYIDGSIAVPSATIHSAAGATENNPNYINWYTQDQILLGWLRSTILVPVLVQVILPETSAGLWSAILELYGRPPLSRIVELQQKLRLCHRGGLSCTIYLEKMKSFADELASLGAPISDKDLMAKMSLNLNLGPLTGRFLKHYTIREACGLLSLKGFCKLVLYYENLLSSQSEAPKASPNKPKRGSGRGTDNSGRRHSYPFFSQGQKGGQHTTQTSLAPTPSLVDCATSPCPRGRGRSRSFRSCGPSLPDQPPQQIPQATFPLVPLQFPVVSAASSSASNEGCIPRRRPVKKDSPSNRTS